MAHWKNDRKKIIIDQNLDPKGWFKVMDHVTYLYNHKEHPGDKYYLPPIK